MISRNATEIIASAVEAFAVTNEPEELYRRTGVLRALLTEWQAQSKTVETTIRTFLSTMQASCAHPDARRGYNERDGSWMSPCPACGASE